MIVYVSHRKALTEKALATLQPINGHSWKSYKDTEKEIDLKDNWLIIVQYEALGRIKGYAESNSHKLIFVLDEFNSICHHWYPCDSASGNASRPIGVDLPVNHALPSDDSRLKCLRRASLRSRFLVRPSCMLQEERLLASRISRLILTLSSRGLVFPDRLDTLHRQPAPKSLRRAGLSCRF